MRFNMDKYFERKIRSGLWFPIRKVNLSILEEKKKKNPQRSERVPGQKKKHNTDVMQEKQLFMIAAFFPTTANFLVSWNA